MAVDSEWDAPEVSVQTLSYFARGVRTFWDLCSLEHRRILIAVCVLALVEGLGLGFPLLFRELVDGLPRIVTQGITGVTIGIVAAMFVLRTVGLVLRRFVQEPIFLAAIIALENHWPKIAQEKLLALSLAYHERENTGRKMAKVTRGSEKLANMLGDLFWTLLPALFYLVINLIVLFVIDWRLALLFLVPLIPGVWLNLSCYKRFYPQWVEYEKLKEKAVGTFCQSVINMRTVQSYVSEEREALRHSAVRDSMCDLDITLCTRIQKYHFAMEMVLGLSFIFAVVTGLYFVYVGWSTVGTVSYLFITGNVTLQNLWSMVQVYTRMLRDLVSAERLHALLEEEVTVRNTAVGVVPDNPQAPIRFDGVSLVYQGKREPSLQEVTLTIARGEMFALVGPSGSGKSTFVHLLGRACDPTGGRITLDGIDVRDLDRDWYRSMFAFVSQDVEVFDGTIRDNVRYACPEACESWVEEAVRAACLEEPLSDDGRFPDGLDTQVGERGVRLSGGERQRVGIARAYVALLAGATVLVLDEATASLDSRSERVVQDFIERLRREREVTIVAIAHRLSTIQKADRICVFESGRIVEIGTHEKLLHRNGLYARLVALQQLGELRE